MIRTIRRAVALRLKVGANRFGLVQSGIKAWRVTCPWWLYQLKLYQLSGPTLVGGLHGLLLRDEGISLKVENDTVGTK